MPGGRGPTGRCCDYRRVGLRRVSDITACSRRSARPGGWIRDRMPGRETNARARWWLAASSGRRHVALAAAWMFFPDRASAGPRTALGRGGDRRCRGLSSIPERPGEEQRRLAPARFARHVDAPASDSAATVQPSPARVEWCSAGRPSAKSPAAVPVVRPRPRSNGCTALRDPKVVSDSRSPNNRNWRSAAC